MTGVKLVAGGYLASGIVGLLADAVPSPSMFSSWLQYGALGILGGTTFGLFTIIVKLVDGYQKLSDAAEEREALRHQDSEKLNETLAKMRENCAAINAAKK